MSKTQDLQYKKLSETPIPKLILEMGFPTTVSMLVTNLYNMADTWFVSHISISAAGAVGIIFGLMAIIQAFGFTFGHGAGSNISRLLGAGEKEKANTYSSTGFLLSLLFGFLVGILGLLFINPLCRILGSTETILPFARTYAIYILISAPAMAASCVLNNVLRYEGYASFAMIGLVSGSVLNIGGDALFIEVFHMGVVGAGLSTMISQYLSFSLLLSFFLMGKTQTRLSIKCIKIDTTVVGNIFTTGFPAMVRQGLISISTMTLNSQAAVYGDEAIAAMSVVSRICNFLYSIALGIGQGLQPVCAFNYGAKLYQRVKKSLYFTVGFGTIVMLILSFLATASSETLVRSFLSDETAIAIALFALKIQCGTLIVIPLYVSGNMMFQAIGLPMQAILLSALRSGLTFIPVLYVLSHFFGLFGIQIAQPVADVVTALISLPFLLKFVWSLSN